MAWHRQIVNVNYTTTHLLGNKTGHAEHLARGPAIGYQTEVNKEIREMGCQIYFFQTKFPILKQITMVLCHPNLGHQGPPLFS